VDVTKLSAAESAPLDMIAVGPCPRCSGPAQFIAGAAGEIDVVRAIAARFAPPAGPGAEQLADLIMDSMGCDDCNGTTVCAAHVQAFAAAYGAQAIPGAKT
jgi:hypothetical protein